MLITAAMAGMVLSFTTRHMKGGKRSQRELVVARFRGEYERPSPKPGPGVFATSNSVATPALLPDGSVAPESLSELIESTPTAKLQEHRKQLAAESEEPGAKALVGSDTREGAGSDEGEDK